MAVIMKAVYNIFGKVIGMEEVESGDKIETLDESGQSVSMNVAESLDIVTYDLTATPEIQMTTTDSETVVVGKGVVMGHPIHLDIKHVGVDATIASHIDAGTLSATSNNNMDGGELSGGD